MMTNAQIAKRLSLYSELLDLHGENAFRVKSYATAAYALERIPEPVSSASAGEIEALSINSAAKGKIREMVETGELKALQEILETTPAGLLQLLEVKGLGPKKLHLLWKERGIVSPQMLQEACTNGGLKGLKGFGAKTEQSVCEALSFWVAQQGKLRWATAFGEAQIIMAGWQKALPHTRIEMTGGLRRQMETLSRLDFLTTGTSEEVASFLGGLPGELTVLEGNRAYELALAGKPVLRIYTTVPARWGTDWALTTGNELFISAFLNQSFETLNACATEEAFFEQTGIPPLPPPRREPENNQIAEDLVDVPLIKTSDIRGLIHCHSDWSDGGATITEMAAGAQALGLEYMVMSDHSQAAQYAGGLTPQRIQAQHAEIEALNKTLTGFKVFKSIESDILGDGALDYEPAVLRSFDLVIVSVHSNLQMPQEKAMERLMAAIQNPYTSVMGHLTGRLLLKREGYPIDHRTLIEACAAHDVAIEINANPWRLDMDWRWVNYALDRGVLISINPDSHSVAGISDIEFGVRIAQKNGLTPAQNLSSFSLAQMEDYVARQKAKRG
jgi:DNA polymerase (family 10)